MSFSDGNSYEPYVRPEFDDEDVLAVYDILLKQSNIKGSNTDTKRGTITIVRPISTIKKAVAEVRETATEMWSPQEMDMLEVEHSFAVFRRGFWAAIFKGLQVYRDGSMDFMVLESMNEDMKRACIDGNGKIAVPRLVVSHLKDDRGNAFLKVIANKRKCHFIHTYEPCAPPVAFWAKQRAELTVRASLTDEEAELLMSEKVGITLS